MLDGLKGQLKKYNEIKLALQATIYMTPTTQGDALGLYKLALQAGNPKPGLYQIYFLTRSLIAPHLCITSSPV
jgi:hypothetical protein